ncbi:MAG: heparinase II/III family protein [Bacteroidales bacterium]|nr:heparinase II/III family protein [Bacteroidales bacterium]MDT8432356.1 heparinase II/III family protein [Bacteroidales bacterium]
MKNLVKLIVIFVTLCWGSAANAQKETDLISAHINPATLSHPYLLFNQEGKKQMLEDIKNDRELSEIYEKQMLEASRYLKMPGDYSLPEHKQDKDYYGILRSFHYAHLGPALSLAFAYQLTGNPEYAEKAFFHADMLCQVDAWTYVFHRFPYLYRRVWPWGVDDDQVVFSYDIQTARISTHLALVYDWIYDYMNKGQRDRIRGALLENSITRVRGNYEYYWWAAAHRCNWSGVCYAGVGMASLALLKEDPQLIDVVERAYEGVSLMLDELGVDGGWSEGRGYWSYMLGHSSWFMETVKQLTGNSYNLFTHPRLKYNVADFALYTMYANFCDGSGGPVGSSWLMNKLIEETGDQTAAWYRDTFLESGESIYDLIYRKPDVTGKEPEVKSKHFRTIHWAAMQSSFTDPNTVRVVCKAGENDDPHHGHLDCGQFIINYKGENFISEPARAEYDLFYFAKERWDYVQASSEGHNVVFVNGEQQIPAKIKDEPWRESTGTNIDEFYTSDKTDYVVMNHLEKAYPGIEMKSWKRKIVLEKPVLSIVIDRIESEKNAEIRSRIHPGGEVELFEKYYTITSAQGDVMTVVPFSDQEISMEARRHASLRTHVESLCKWIPYVDTYTKTKNNHTIMGYLVFPFNGVEETDVVLHSLRLQQGPDEALQVSFSFNGGQHLIAF